MIGDNHREKRLVILRESVAIGNYGAIFLIRVRRRSLFHLRRRRLLAKA